MIYGHCENSAREFFYIDLSQLKYIFFYKLRDPVRVVGGSDAVVTEIGFIIYDSWQYIVFYCSKWMSNIFVKQY